MAKKIVAGNWKLYKTPTEAIEYFKEFLSLAPKSWDSSLIFFPSAFALDAVSALRTERTFNFGPQNMATEKEGAMTGELSAAHAKMMGATHVLIGHSERRLLFNETNEMIAKKVSLATELGLVPVLCLGETLDQRKAGRTFDVIAEQLKAGLRHWNSSERLIVAYEPVWAIGTGAVATPEQVEEAHTALRKELQSLVGNVSLKISLLYGGSVKPENAAQLIARPNVDGFLVGGASLKPKDFLAIAKSAL